MNEIGIIFDFNGTLFWDTEYQNSSWDEYLTKQNVILSAEEKSEFIYGRNGKDTFEYIFKKTFTSGEIDVLTEKKEVYYRNECLRHKMELAPGAEDLLAELLIKNVPIAIATASAKPNVDFFIEKFNLLRFFKPEHIIYNDGTVNGKPLPDIFNKAIDALGVKKENIIIFEDSASGVEAALRAKVRHVIIVDSAKNDWGNTLLPKIDHFDLFDRTLLKS